MKLDLNEIALCSGKRYTYTLQEEPLGRLSDELDNDTPVTGELTFSNTGSAICVRGSFETELSAVCSRCLEPYRLKLGDTIDEILPLGGEPSDSELYLDDEACPIFRNNIFDLTELLRQCILVQAPSWGVCSKDCKGLCPGCGANLNREECACDKSEFLNPAFAKLSELIKDKTE
ncbi:MAG: DUF177 domain-containing protein [Abditibacteriota bacterium]|nr:DUF177 domain-containing protein [Abditibacteriota bacterium]